MSLPLSGSRVISFSTGMASSITEKSGGIKSIPLGTLLNSVKIHNEISLHAKYEETVLHPQLNCSGTKTMPQISF